MARTLPTIKTWFRVRFYYRPRDVVELAFYGEVGADFDTFVYYTDRDVDDVDGMITYSACPTMEIKFPKRTGALNEELLSIHMPMDEFTTTLARAEQHAPISCRIQERDDSGFVHGTFLGWVRRSLKNQDGRPGRVRIDVENVKNMFRVPQGIPATPQCAWTFTSRPCSVDVADTGADKLKKATITNVNRETKLVTATVEYTGGAPWAGAENDRLYHRGYMVRNGVRIEIREWHSDHPDRFYLMENWPEEWDFEDVIVFPGCDKFRSTCVNRWDNEQRFGGLGEGIPAYNPLLETP